MTILEFVQMFAAATADTEGMPLVLAFVAVGASYKVFGKYLEKLGEAIASRHAHTAQEEMLEIAERIKFRSTRASLKMQKIEQLMERLAAVTGTCKNDVINIQAAHTIAQLFSPELLPAVVNFQRHIRQLASDAELAAAGPRRRGKAGAPAARREVTQAAGDEVLTLLAQVGSAAAEVMREIEAGWADR